MRQLGLTLCLREGPEVAELYRSAHRDPPPAVLSRLRQAGITGMRIYLTGRRLFMYLETVDDFELERDLARLGDDPEYRRWEQRMGSLQEPAPEAGQSTGWSVMEQVFDLRTSSDAAGR